MVFNPFDYNEATRHRRDSVEDRLREGSPVVGISFDKGLLLLTVRRTQRKVFEVYDRLIYSAIGNQSDIESIRVGAIDVAHKEGYDRSPDDVTIQRIVGFALSPPLKRLFGDTWNAQPAVIRALFGELGPTPENDLFFVLNYDGEYSQHQTFAAVAGTQEAEDRMVLTLMGVGPDTTREQALERAIKAWGVGAMESRRRQIGEEDEDENPLRDIDEDEQVAGFLRTELKTGEVEAGILERFSTRESKFRLLTDGDLKDVLAPYK
jgi:proteasome alpha subunit